MFTASLNQIILSWDNIPFREEGREAVSFLLCLSTSSPPQSCSALPPAGATRGVPPISCFSSLWSVLPTSPQLESQTHLTGGAGYNLMQLTASGFPIFPPNALISNPSSYTSSNFRELNGSSPVLHPCPWPYLLHYAVFYLPLPTACIFDHHHICDPFLSMGSVWL